MTTKDFERAATKPLIDAKNDYEENLKVAFNGWRFRYTQACAAKQKPMDEFDIFKAGFLLFAQIIQDNHNGQMAKDA